MASHNSFNSTLLNLRSNLLGISTSETSLKGRIISRLRSFFAGNYRFNVVSAEEMPAEDLRYMLGKTQDAEVKAPEGTHHVEEVKAVLKSFEAGMQIPFNMYMAGYTYGEIAEELNLTETEVRSRIFNASRSLQEQLSA
ncbi:MAG: hypothetical protein K2K93_06400 [Muribaculaceae bacterium]|nr:hypothetical protein [Muribaculaceae bacterium]